MKKHIGFIQSVQSLRESSKDAIIDGEVFSLNTLKEYLHIEREIESKLASLIARTSQNNKSQLVLVCGNVGDGKSHILSFLNKKISSDFKIHNDATESFNPDESFLETLDRLLINFKDENLGQSKDKIILAINLGTLNNFLESRKNEYGKLYDYVHDKGILDSDDIQDERVSKSSHFQYVNFTDYQLYELTKDGPISKILSSLLDRIFAPVNDNPIYKSYVKFKKDFQNYSCPIFYNWEFLSDKTNRETVVQLLLKAIIKSKEIVSLRSILNFIHDILIPIPFQIDEVSKMEKVLKKLNEKTYVENIIPNYLFEHPELSKLFEKIGNEDPCNYRTEDSDDNIIRIVNANEIESHVREQLPTKILHNNFPSFLQAVKNYKELLSKTFLRLVYFSDGKQSDLSDPYFKTYVKLLYHYNIMSKKESKQLFEIVRSACINWNGNPEKEDRIVLPLGAKQNRYRILIPFNPRIVLTYKPVPTEETLYKFRNQLKVVFKNKNSNEIPLYLDYGLLKLLIKVSNGYRPNKLDKNSYINFVNFLNELVASGIDNNSLEIDEINVGKHPDYLFSFNEAFEEFEFKNY